MLPDRVSNPGPLTYEYGALPIALRGPAPIVVGCQRRVRKEQSGLAKTPLYKTGFHITSNYSIC